MTYLQGKEVFYFSFASRLNRGQLLQILCSPEFSLAGITSEKNHSLGGVNLKLVLFFLKKKAAKETWGFPDALQCMFSDDISNLYSESFITLLKVYFQLYMFTCT